MDTSFARTWLRLEGLAVLLCTLPAYRYFHLPWLWFSLLLLAPDLAALGYLAGSRVGAWAYNLAHFYAFALTMVALGLLTGQRVELGLGLIWCAHIGFDRALGYGLKSPAGFRFTHLGKIGRDKPAQA
ncbi:DUF4260 domain-containing protein [Opitutus sp. GAS368]|jgi:hypothetical protein|uniref:DUF4260 domain-containing protein n=1 Tax=Opitutus sp. GAS368 TaxID=1882749 RepID=UPI00087D3768|nr:DUF4260 domain-containing protein [Opitutus sp. GAS368]SDS20058.1 protein of unknown function [Opitutus sp. GAS368]